MNDLGKQQFQMKGRADKLIGIIKITLLVSVVIFLTLKGTENRYSLREENLKKTIELLTDQLSNTRDELLEARFKLGIKHFWNVDEVVRSPQDKTKFYYTTSDGSGESIWAYDLNRDSNYTARGYFDFPLGNTMLYNEKLPEGKIFQLLEIDYDGNLVFWEPWNDFSPGPGFSPWQSPEVLSNLYALDLTKDKLEKKSYTYPKK
ncbi:MAG: hypothetical protein Q8P95_01125 [bacterium]|nr:hypothetical protein [bacterium]